jgi:uncharacterized protein (TIGR00369 family)
MDDLKRPAVMSAKQIDELLTKEFPGGYHSGCGLIIERVDYGNCRVRRSFDESIVRPGGTISGAKMMELADFAMYVAVFSAYGALPLAVTTNLNINFLRKPAQADLIAEVRLMKVGKRLAVGEVTIYSDGSPDAVAHVTSTYSIPDGR